MAGVVTAISAIGSAAATAAPVLSAISTGLSLFGGGRDAPDAPKVSPINIPEVGEAPTLTPAQGAFTSEQSQRADAQERLRALLLTQGSGGTTRFSTDVGEAKTQKTTLLGE